MEVIVIACSVGGIAGAYKYFLRELTDSGDVHFICGGTESKAKIDLLINTLPNAESINMVYLCKDKDGYKYVRLITPNYMFTLQRMKTGIIICKDDRVDNFRSEDKEINRNGSLKRLGDCLNFIKEKHEGQNYTRISNNHSRFADSLYHFMICRDYEDLQAVRTESEKEVKKEISEENIPQYQNNHFSNQKI